VALAGLPEIRFHDLRHTHASLLIAAGVHPKAIQARLGHSSITMTMDRYGHLMPSAFEGVGERVDDLLRRKGTLELRSKEDRRLKASIASPG
jgi:integrase